MRHPLKSASCSQTNKIRAQIVHPVHPAMHQIATNSRERERKKQLIDCHLIRRRRSERESHTRTHCLLLAPAHSQVSSSAESSLVTD